tara:strand:+ start:2162 stop:3049 length:888 start_codon:yes stop_codon:yes gene_type:complete
MRKESFDRASSEITSFFKRSTSKAYTTNDIQEIFNTNRDIWRIAGYRNYKNFITYLSDNKILILDVQNHEYRTSKKQILRKHNCTPFDVGLTVKKEGYLSNYSAMQIHQLTLQIPKTIYISEDKTSSNDHVGNVILEQSSVDKAFSKPQRIATESYKSEYDGFKYVYLKRKHKFTNIGVARINNLAVTDLERTLIDIAVRPAYSGGAFQILEAYKNSRGKVNPDKISTYLDELDYIYPYHQLVGFYLDLAGFDDKDLKQFSNKKSNINFYQTYNLSNKKLNTKWGIYYPSGIEAL